MGLRGIKTDLETLRDLLAGVSASPATPDSIQPDLDEITKLLSKLLADTDEIADVVTEQLRSLIRRFGRRLIESRGPVLQVNKQLNYVGVEVPDPKVSLPEQGLKNRGEYHITVIGPPELSGKDPEAIDALDGHQFQTEPTYVCLGKQEQGDNAAYYVVVDWPEAQELRKKFGLDHKDLHITVGFRTKDIHYVPKDSSTCVAKLQPAKQLAERTFKQELPVEYPPKLIDVLSAIKDAGGFGLIIGGAVRDALLGKVGKDIDVEVYGLAPDNLTSVLGKFGDVNAVGKSFGVYKLRLGDTDFDFSIPRRERKSGTGHRGFDVDVDHGMDYVDAARRRDFTINTLGYDPLTQTVYDPHGGLDDLKKGVIRMTDKAAFSDDPLRVLRMAQFASRFGFKIDPETMDYAKVAAELETLPSERLFEEFKKALVRSKKPGDFVRVLKDAAVIDRLFPQLKGVEDESADLLDQVAASDASGDDRLILGLTALTHKLSEADAKALLGKLTNETAIHQRVKNIRDVFAKELPKDDTGVRQVLSKLDDQNIPLVKTMARTLFGSSADEFVTKLDALKGTTEPLVQGRHLVDLGVPKGPKIGQLLKKLYDLQLKGEFADLEGGIEKAKAMVGTQTEKADIRTLLGQLREASGGNKVIVLDVDGTLVDVNDRAARAMKDAGVEVSPENWQDALAELEYPAKDVFYRAFLSDKYSSMDREFSGVMSQVKKLYDREQIPVVVLTGRPQNMSKSTEAVVDTLMGKGIPIRELILRPESEAKTKTPSYKIKMLQQRGYDPKYIFDDDHRVLAGFASAFPNANIFRVDGGSIRKYQTVRESQSRLAADLKALRPELAAAAQKVYDEWEQDDNGADVELGAGGICDAVSDAMGSVVGSKLGDVELLDGGQDGDDHAWLVVTRGNEAFGVDIHPGVYEIGGGYSWKKRSGVKFRPDHVEIFDVPVPEPG